jgi:hypothetical protein
MVAESWIKEMERIFRLCRRDVTEEDKVDLATYMLKGESLHWWETVLERLGDSQSCEWVEFKKIFLEKHFPMSVHYKLEEEFMTLTQGGKSVLQYEQEFNRLSRYAPTLVSDEATKTRRFIKGLIPPIRQRIILLDIETFRRAVDKAMTCESEYAQDRS